MQKTPSPLTPATTLKEVSRNCKIKDLRPDQHKPFLVEELYARDLRAFKEKFLDSLEDANCTALYLTGYIGSGKTTFINRFIADKEIASRFTPLIVDFKEYVAQTDDEVQVEDILLFLIYALSNKSDKTITTQYERRLNELIEVRDGSREVEDTKTSVAGAGLGLKILDIINLKYSEERSRHIRQRLRVRKKELLDLVNELFESVNNPQQPCLFILDDLEKALSEKALAHIVRVGLSDLEQLRFNKIIIIPPHVLTITGNNPLVLGKDYHLETKIISGLAPGEEVDTKIAHNKTLLEKILRRRLADPAAIIDDPEKFFETIIQLSGGLLVQLCELMNEAAFQARMADSPKMRLEYLEKAREKLAGSMIRGVFARPGIMAVLYRVLETNNLDNPDLGDEEKSSCVRAGAIILLNSERPFFVLNPIIANSVRFYAEQRNRTDA